MQNTFDLINKTLFKSILIRSKDRRTKFNFCDFIDNYSFYFEWIVDKSQFRAIIKNFTEKHRNLSTNSSKIQRIRRTIHFIVFVICFYRNISFSIKHIKTTTRKTFQLCNHIFLNFLKIWTITKCRIKSVSMSRMNFFSHNLSISSKSCFKLSIASLQSWNRIWQSSSVEFIFNSNNSHIKNINDYQQIFKN